MPFVAYPLPPHDPVLDLVASTLDPVLSPLGFAPGQLGTSDRHAQVDLLPGYRAASTTAASTSSSTSRRHRDGGSPTSATRGYPTERWHLPFVEEVSWRSWRIWSSGSPPAFDLLVRSSEEPVDARRHLDNPRNGRGRPASRSVPSRRGRQIRMSYRVESSSPTSICSPIYPKRCWTTSCTAAPR